MKEDEFCLTHDEAQRVAEYVAAQELAEAILAERISRIVERFPSKDGKSPQDLQSATGRVRRILETCLYNRAESFAAAMIEGNIAQFGTEHLPEIVSADLNKIRTRKGDVESDPDWISAVVHEILADNSAEIQSHLRDLADAYTLLAFLRQTPDVQSAVEKMFSHGEIWLDTSFILPLIAEDLLEDGTGQYQQMVQLATEAGVAFFVTSGVVEEVDTHINRAIVCSRAPQNWKGKVPFVLDAFLQAGGSAGEFQSWTELFRGGQRPVDDVFEFLEERFQIKRRDLEPKVLDADKNFRYAVQEAWTKVHERRREKFGGVVDPISIVRLSKHDTENYLGVIQERKQEKPSPLGYSAWWLTLDKAAQGIGDLLKREFNVKCPPDSPIMSIDFLSQYLTFGPGRSRISKASLRSLPVVMEPHFVRFLTPDLLEEANRIRAEMKTVPERVIRRRIRDYLDNARSRLGPLAQRGVETIFDEIEAQS
jgi:hypothetical protein